MQRRMFAELLFDNPEARDRAVAVLERDGYSITFLAWRDEYNGIVLSPVCWIEVRGVYAGSASDFMTEMGGIANAAGGEVIEAGLEFPPSFSSQDDNDDVPLSFRD